MTRVTYSDVLEHTLAFVDIVTIYRFHACDALTYIASNVGDISRQLYFLGRDILPRVRALRDDGHGHDFGEVFIQRRRAPCPGRSVDADLGSY